MKEVKVLYSKIENMGDLLNELIIEDVFGYKIVNSNPLNAHTTGIGSGLNAVFPPKPTVKRLPKHILKKIYNQFKSPSQLQIWSSGFINYSNQEHICLRKNTKVAAVRGELTRKRLEKILNTKLHVPTGDGGLLASYLVKKPIQKKYSVGIIPHFKEKDEIRFKTLAESYNNSIVIDLTDDPLKVVETIAECEVILSSSLHGLIVADSFGIPNKRVTYTNKLMGDGYKFNDYYSAFNVTPVQHFDLNTNGFPSYNSIIDDYKISKAEVEKKKDELLKSFSTFL